MVDIYFALAPYATLLCGIVIGYCLHTIIAVRRARKADLAAARKERDAQNS